MPEEPAVEIEDTSSKIEESAGTEPKVEELKVESQTEPTATEP